MTNTSYKEKSKSYCYKKREFVASPQVNVPPENYTK